MGIASWLSRVLQGDNVDESGARPGASSLPPEPQEEAASGLNFRTAIEAHQKWKMRLQAVVDSKSREKLDPKVVCRDDQCDLGKWIDGEGARQFAGQAQFVDLSRKHTYFHVCAGHVLTLAQSGQRDLATAALASGGEFATASRDVVGVLASMFMRLKDVKA